MKNLLESLRQIPIEKWDLLALLLKEQGLDPFQLLPIPRRNEIAAPLSFAQERLWFINKMEPNSSAYNVSISLRLAGSVNVDALQQSLGEIRRRHEILRTTFSSKGEQPAQVIDPALPLALPQIDISALPAGVWEEEFNQLVNEESQQPFNLGEGPVVRFILVHLREQLHALLVNVHHIVCDGWSVGIFLEEMDQLHVAFSSGNPSNSPDLPIQYGDYAAWQRQWIQGEVLDGQLSYWMKQLSGIPRLLELPTDHPRSPLQVFNGATRSFTASRSLSDDLQQFTRQEKATLFITLLAAFQVLLYRYSGQIDICVGSPIANRNRPELEPLIGFFVNTLVMRGDLSGGVSFRQFLRRMRSVALEAYANQDVPFQAVVEALQPERTLSGSPLFQLMFEVQHVPAGSQESTGLTFAVSQSESRTAKFDLSLGIVGGGDQIAGTLEYNADLFDPARIDRMLNHFQVLLGGILANPDQKVSDLPLLTEA
jgi:hypothetical protein